MPFSVSVPKDPRKVAGGRKGMLSRFGLDDGAGGLTPRIIRLDALTPEQRRLVLALVAAAHEQAAPAIAKSRPDPAEAA